MFKKHINSDLSCIQLTLDQIFDSNSAPSQEKNKIHVNNSNWNPISSDLFSNNPANYFVIKKYLANNRYEMFS